MLQMLRSMKSLFRDVVPQDNAVLLASLRSVADNNVDKAEVRMRFLQSVYYRVRQGTKKNVNANDQDDDDDFANGKPEQSSLSRVAIATDLFRIASDEQLIDWKVLSSPSMQADLEATLQSSVTYSSRSSVSAAAARGPARSKLSLKDGPSISNQSLLAKLPSQNGWQRNK